MKSKNIVYVIDPDAQTRAHYEGLLKFLGVTVKGFGDAASFLHVFDPIQCACVIVDLWLPDKSGLDLLKALTLDRAAAPVIVVASQATIANAVRALKIGAFDFFEKPNEDRELAQRVHEALIECEARLRANQERDDIRTKMSELTRRQQDVLELVMKGMSNKLIANTLAISEKTVEIHRQRVMHEMGVRHVAELARMVFRLQDRRRA